MIAALADAVVVVEAGWRSGSLNTAAHAASLGRALGAVPGPVTSAASAGCHRILREFDGVCVTSASDVHEMLGGPTTPGPEGGTTRGDDVGEHGGDDGGEATARGRTDDATRVRDALSPRAGRSSEEVARRSGLSVAQVRTLLGLAELGGRVIRDADGGWRAAKR